MNIGIAQRPKAGEQSCGDVLAIAGDAPRLLVMLCDGTGHGPSAAMVSALAAKHVRAHADLPLVDILEGCGRALHGTRGGAVALLRVDSEHMRLEFASVGNVELRAACRHPVAPICSPGIVGRPVRKIHTFSYPLSAGDRLVLFTDGIARRLDLGAVAGLEAQAAADRILQEHGVTRDDATCVVVDVAPGVSDLTEPPRLGPHVDISVARPEDIIRCGAEAQRQARRLGFDAVAQQQLAIIARELASNIHKYAAPGVIRLSPLPPPRVGLEVCAQDRGDGIEDIAAACEDGHTRSASAPAEGAAGARRSLGTGLGAVRRMADEVTIASDLGSGTRVVARKFLPGADPPRAGVAKEPSAAERGIHPSDAANGTPERSE